MLLHGIGEFICQMLDNVRKAEKISGITLQFAGDAFTPNGPIVLLLLENSKGYLNKEFLCVECITEISRLQLNMVFCICIKPSVQYPSFFGEKFEISRPANSFLGSSSCACNSNKTIALGKVGR